MLENIVKQLKDLDKEIDARTEEVRRLREEKEKIFKEAVPHCFFKEVQVQSCTCHDNAHYCGYDINFVGSFDPTVQLPNEVHVSKWDTEWKLNGVLVYEDENIPFSFGKTKEEVVEDLLT